MPATKEIIPEPLYLDNVCLDNYDSANRDYDWMEVCQGCDARRQLRTQDWIGGPYAPRVYVAASEQEAQLTRDALRDEEREHARAQWAMIEEMEREHEEILASVRRYGMPTNQRDPLELLEK